MRATIPGIGLGIAALLGLAAVGDDPRDLRRAWALPLAAVEEDRLAWVLTLAFCAYILPDGIPL